MDLIQLRIEQPHVIDGLKKKKRPGLCVCLVPGHPDRSGQLRDQPVLRLAALAHCRRSGGRIRSGLRPQDGPQRVVKTFNVFPTNSVFPSGDTAES